MSTTVSQERINEIQNKLRYSLAQRGGSKTIRSLGKAFTIADTNKNKSLDADEFERVLKRCGLFLSQPELAILYRYYDRDGGGINYDEFLQGLQGQMNERRTAMVTRAYRAMDRDGNGTVTMDDIRDRYDAKRHPKVVAGQATEEQVLREFLDTFEGAGGNRDGIVTLDEFINYYTAISASIPYNDDYFILMMENAWAIREDNNESACPPALVQRFETVLKEKIRQKTRMNEAESNTLMRTFKFFDLDQSGTISEREWRLALERYGIVLTPQDLIRLFRYYDTDSSGHLSYEEFVKAIYENEQ